MPLPGASPVPKARGVKMQNRAGAPLAPWSSACHEIRLYCSQQGADAETQLRFSFPCDLISLTEPGVLGWAVQD